MREYRLNSVLSKTHTISYQLSREALHEREWNLAKDFYHKQIVLSVKISAQQFRVQEKLRSMGRGDGEQGIEKFAENRKMGHGE